MAETRSGSGGQQHRRSSSSSSHHHHHHSSHHRSHSHQESRDHKSGSRPRVCRYCGQHHSHHEPHLYNYKEEVDEDLMCQICLQPFVSPVDTPCSHTFCSACLHNYIKVNPLCPLDRKPLNEMTCSPSNLVLKRLLDKLQVTCPNSDSCEEVLPRGNLDDHLRYRCSGTMVACQFAGAGCDFRGPSKSINKHQMECRFKTAGITRLPVLEGEVSHVEIPRTSSSLGITIVGGADTPLRCVVVQEVFPDGLIAQDGRLQPGDQIIEINGVDMTCASHSQVCAALRKMSSVLRLGVYRERIEKYGARPSSAASNSSGSIRKSNGNSSSSTKTTTLSTTTPTTSTSTSATGNTTTNGANSSSSSSSNEKINNEELLSVTLERLPGKQLGIRLSGNCSESGIYIVDIQDGSTTQIDGRLQLYDRLLFINGQDVRSALLSQASSLIQNNDKVSLVVARRKSGDPPIRNYDKETITSSASSAKKPQLNQSQKQQQNNGNGLTVAHARSKSAPAPMNNHHEPKNGNGSLEHYETYGTDPEDEEDDDEDDDGGDDDRDEVDGLASSKVKRNLNDDHHYDIPEGTDDYMAIYETIDRKRQESKELAKSHSMEALETPTKKQPQQQQQQQTQQQQSSSSSSSSSSRRRHRSKPHSSGSSSNNKDQNNRRSFHESTGSSMTSALTAAEASSALASPPPPTAASPMDFSEGGSMAAFLKRALRIEGPQLQQRTVIIKKNPRESLGMRIGGGIGSNEGDTPIYIANIHPHGCIGKSKQMKKGDILLTVDGTSLCGLTHSQAVATLKATINLSQVTLGIMDGPETSYGASNFIPSWMYWQKMPRDLHYPKTVILHRRENASWGFSIVGGADPSSNGRPMEPIHVLFVVPDSPAAKDGRIKCGDRLLAVDGHSLENIPHAMAVGMLKQTSTRVVMEVVSWMGTEL